MYFSPQRVWYRKDWKCASVRGWPERIFGIAAVRSGIGEMGDETHDGMQISLHKLFVQVYFIEIAARLEDNVHIV